MGYAERKESFLVFEMPCQQWAAEDHLDRLRSLYVTRIGLFHYPHHNICVERILGSDTAQGCALSLAKKDCDCQCPAFCMSLVIRANLHPGSCLICSGLGTDTSGSRCQKMSSSYSSKKAHVEVECPKTDREWKYGLKDHIPQTFVESVRIRSSIRGNKTYFVHGLLYTCFTK